MDENIRRKANYPNGFEVVSEVRTGGYIMANHVYFNIEIVV